MDATTYHRHTSYNRYRMTPHRLDWGNVPRQNKAYAGLPAVALKPEPSGPAMSLADVLAGNTPGIDAPKALGFQDLSLMLSLANGVTATRRYGSQTMHFRSAPSAGALYPNEIYVAAGSVAGLDPGLYNFQAAEASLVKVADDAVLPMIGRALKGSVGPAPAASLPLTALFFRSAWKYRERAFRYVLLDGGHLLENLVLAIRAMGYRFSVHYDFDDDAMIHCLGLDGEREVCLAVINLYDNARAASSPWGGVGRTDVPGDGPDRPQTVMDACRVAAVETRYDAILEAYRAGRNVVSGSEADGPPNRITAALPRTWFPVIDPGLCQEAGSYLNSVLRRRSRRNFVSQPLATKPALALLQSLGPTHNPDGDDGNVHAGCVTCGFIAANVEAFDPGIYLLDTAKQRYGLIAGVRYADESLGEATARFCLDQLWLKKGSLHVVFMANLPRIGGHLGARGYRYAMLNAGRAGQRIYLAATALGCGACGIGAIYDDEAKKVLGLNDGSALLYLVAVGAVRTADR